MNKFYKQKEMKKTTGEPMMLKYQKSNKLLPRRQSISNNCRVSYRSKRINYSN